MEKFRYFIILCNDVVFPLGLNKLVILDDK